MANPRPQREAICALVFEAVGRRKQPPDRVWPTNPQREKWRFFFGGTELRFQGISEPEFGGLGCRERVAVFCAANGRPLPLPTVSDADVRQITFAVYLRPATVAELEHTGLGEAVVELAPADVSQTRVVFQLTGRVALFNSIVSA